VAATPQSSQEANGFRSCCGATADGCQLRVNNQTLARFFVCSNRIEKIKTMSDWLRRAAALPAQLRANAVPQAIDPETRV